MAQISERFVFQKGFVFDRNRIYFMTNHQESTEKEIPNTQLFILSNNADWFSHNVLWEGVGVTAFSHPVRTCIMLGRDGNVLVGTPSGFSEEVIDCGGYSPLSRGPLRNIKNINGSIFAVGMGRQIYQRRSTNDWIRFDKGIPESVDLFQVTGLNSIGGVDADDLYAVGWEGEIWHYEDNIWKKVDSPTNVALFDVLAVSQTEIYMCGQYGTIFKGFGNRWQVIEYEGPRLNFRSMAWFKNRLYLADGHSLRVLSDGKLELVDFGIGQAVPSSYLHENDGLLLSLAGKELFITGDTVHWKSLLVE